MTEVTFNVEGMSCGHCKAAVEVAYDEERVTIEDLRDAVQEAGYTLAV